MTQIVFLRSSLSVDKLTRSHKVSFGFNNKLRKYRDSKLLLSLPYLIKKNNNKGIDDATNVAAK